MAEIMLMASCGCSAKVKTVNITKIILLLLLLENDCEMPNKAEAKTQDNSHAGLSWGCTYGAS